MPIIPGSITPIRDNAEACFQKAIAIAGEQGAKSLELRATLCLARLWQTQGKTATAEQKLAETYGFFTEGLDTVDLRQAKALLDKMAKDKAI